MRKYQRWEYALLIILTVVFALFFWLAGQEKEDLTGSGVVANELLVVSVETENGGEIVSKDEYLNAEVSIGRSENKRPYFYGVCRVKGHGTSSWYSSKRSYQLKFDSEATPFSGARSAEKWLLISNSYDKTLSRNALAYTMMSRFKEIKNPLSFRFAELYLNGEYQGLYLLCGKAQLDEASDADTGSEFNAATDVKDTSFLLELTTEKREISSGGIRDATYVIVRNRCYAIKSPDMDNLSPEAAQEQIAEITSYMETAVGTLLSGTWEEIAEIYDTESFAATYIIQELFANEDVGGCSFYLYRDNNGKLCCGPVWDFDIGGGNSYNQGSRQSCPPVGYLWATDNVFYRTLLEHAEFEERVCSKLREYDAILLAEIETANPENSGGYYQTYREAIDRNFANHQVLGKHTNVEPLEVSEISTAYGQFAYLYQWLSARYDYIKEYYQIA